MQLNQEELMAIIGNVITGDGSNPTSAETLGKQPDTERYRREIANYKL
jgi:hypothetical protein